MKNINPSYLFYFAGILWIFAGIISEDMKWGYALGFAFIALGIAKRIKDCKKECVTFTISSDEWCDCMHQCSQKVIDKISFGDMNVKIYIEECP